MSIDCTTELENVTKKSQTGEKMRLSDPLSFFLCVSASHPLQFLPCSLSPPSLWTSFSSPSAFISLYLKLLEECQSFQKGQIWAALHSSLLCCVEMYTVGKAGGGTWLIWWQMGTRQRGIHLSPRLTGFQFLMLSVSHAALIPGLSPA